MTIPTCLNNTSPYPLPPSSVSTRLTLVPLVLSLPLASSHLPHHLGPASHASFAPSSHPLVSGTPHTTRGSGRLFGSCGRHRWPVPGGGWVGTSGLRGGRCTRQSETELHCENTVALPLQSANNGGEQRRSSTSIASRPFSEGRQRRSPLAPSDERCWALSIQHTRRLGSLLRRAPICPTRSGVVARSLCLRTDAHGPAFRPPSRTHAASWRMTTFIIGKPVNSLIEEALSPRRFDLNLPRRERATGTAS
jgi:hypothetical protein